MTPADLLTDIADGVSVMVTLALSVEVAVVPSSWSVSSALTTRLTTAPAGPANGAW